MASNIISLNVNNSSYIHRPYGTCTTAAGTAAKVVTCADFASLVTGATVLVKFTYANSVADPTLNVNSKGAKTIKYRGADLAASSLYNWGAGDIVEFYYDGTNWNLLNVGNTDTNTNYYPTTFTWTGGTTSGPTGSLTGSGMSAVSFGAIPAASGSASGVVTTGAQTFAGNKTFSGNVSSPSFIENGTALSSKYQAKGTYLTSQDHYKTSITAGTAGTSSATSGASLAVPYVTVDANGHVTGYGTHTHTISGFLTSETYKGTVTSVATGAGLTGGTITGSGTIKCKLNSETSLGTIGTTSKLYAVGVDASGKLCVNVPWEGGSSDTNTTYTFAGGTNGFTVTPSGGTAQTVTVTPSIANNITGTGSANYMAVFTGTNTISSGPQFSTSTTTFLRNDGTWQTPLESDDALKLVGNGATVTIDGSDVYFALDDDGVVRTTSANNTSLGNSTYPWKALYATTIYEGGTALSSKYQAKGTYATSDTKNTAGSSASTSKLYLIGATSQSSTGVTTYSNANVYINTSSQLCSSLGFYETSDERLKNFGSSIEVNLDELSKIKKSYFKFKNDADNNYIGVSAQEIQKLFPEVVIENDEGYLNVDYAKLSVIALAAIDKLYEEIKELKEKIK